MLLLKLLTIFMRLLLLRLLSFLLLLLLLFVVAALVIVVVRGRYSSCQHQIVVLTVPNTDVFLLYFSGRGAQGLPGRLSEKRAAGVFLDRVGISHDLALAAGTDGSLAPAAALQDAVAGLHHRVRRKVIVLDLRLDLSETASR